ncbi:alpha/beta hydrolase [Nocardia otitidiscaviarum]|uniref:alpha/beta hydrolase n=1 Tax=Nocardia otitidiscaviarum TaxID=1823 RepID=UPI0004A6C902|nr:alpha/beta fold hydrolase [Nocardia otitidiscaviarum]
MAETAWTRHDITFPSSDARCSAWLYLPDDAGTHAAVVMAHGLGAVRELRLDAYAERFADAGYAVLVFDYRHLGASEGQPRQLIDIRRQLDDWHAALTYVRARPDIDTDRIAIWGSSLGGGHVLQISAEDPHLRAVVSQCPFTDGPASTLARTRTGTLSSAVLLTTAILDRLAALLGRRPILVPMAGTKWMPAFLAAPDSLTGAIALAPPAAELSARTTRALRFLPRLRRQILGHLTPAHSGRHAEDPVWGVLRSPTGQTLLINAVSARLALQMPFYRPGRALARTTTPTLVCVCDHDTVAPARTTTRRARGLAHVTLNHYPYGHFDIYVGPEFERAVSDQLAFLAEHLNTGTTP